MEAAAPTGERDFRILESDRGGAPDAPVSPDFATCAECVAELFDPADRRYRYPFTNCTNCGPRFSIVTGVPYDRPLTTMAGFAMCERCRAEYSDPLDRRFHAQPNACPDCGPRALLTDRDGAPLAAGRDQVEAAAEMLAAGSILAIKGIGGYHLACLAADERAVAALRERKRREQKPLALMAPGLEAAARPRGADAGRGGAADRPRAPHRRRPPQGRRSGGGPGRARLSRPRRDAALLAASPPAARRRRGGRW